MFLLNPFSGRTAGCGLLLEHHIRAAPSAFHFEQDRSDDQKRNDEEEDCEDSISDHWSFQGGERRSLIRDDITDLSRDDGSSSEDDRA